MNRRLFNFKIQEDSCKINEIFLDVIKLFFSNHISCQNDTGANSWQRKTDDNLKNNLYIIIYAMKSSTRQDNLAEIKIMSENLDQTVSDY